MKLFPLSVLAIAMFVDLPPAVRAACEDTPSGFLPHGGDAGDTEYVLGAVSGSVPSPVIVFTDWPYLAFGRSDTGTGVQLLQDGWLMFAPLSATEEGVLVVAREWEIHATDQTVGSVFVRHSTTCDDLNPTDDILCGPYDGVLVVTYICVADGPWGVKSSYQILVAHGPSKTIVIIQYGSPMVTATRYVEDSVALDGYYPPNGNDNLLFVDVTDRVYGDILHLESAPCVPLCSEELATMDSCDEPPTKLTICSKSQGVGVVFLEYSCYIGSNDLPIKCKALCCCEPFSSGPADSRHTGPFCARNDVMNWGFGAGSLATKGAFCPGFDLPEAPEQVPSCP